MKKITRNQPLFLSAWIFFNIIPIICGAHKNDSLPNSSILERFYFGGGVGAQFGSVTVVQLAPLIGYKFTDDISAGVRANYTYLNDNNYKYSTNIYGGSIFGRYNIIPALFAHVEYDILNLDAFDSNSSPPIKRRVTADAVLAGGGFNQNLGGNTSVNLMVLWNLTPNAYYPYANPIIRGGIGIGF